MTPRMLTALLLAFSALTACKDGGSSPEQAQGSQPGSPVEMNAAPVRTVAYFLSHHDEHDRVKRHCKNDPGQLRHTPNCINADQAQKEIFVWGRDEAIRRAKGGL